MPKLQAKPRASAKGSAAKTPARKKSVPKKPAAKKQAAKLPQKAPARKKPTAAKNNVKRSAGKTEAAVPQPIKSKLPRSFLNSQLQKLKAERQKYMGSAEMLEEEAESLLNDRVSTDLQASDDSGEGDTTSYYREMDLALSAQAREVVQEIDAAIERINNGTYGICIDSGKPIPKKRLEAIPWASQTVQAKAGGLRRRR